MDFVKKLLSEVEETDLNTLLNEIRLQNTTVSLHAPVIDDVLRTLHHFRRTSHRSNPTIELLSDSPGEGKTQLLYYLISVTTLPPRLHGANSAAVVLDVDGRFDVQRLAEVMAEVAHSESEHPSVQLDNSNDEIDSLVDAVRVSLQHVHIFSPPSPSALLATLHNLSNYLLSPLRHSSGDKTLGLIIVDSISECRWRGFEIAGNAITEPNSDAVPALDDKNHSHAMSELCKSLREAQDLFGCALIITGETTQNMQHYQRHETSFPLLTGLNPIAFPPRTVTSLHTRRDDVKGFSSGMRIARALQESESRQQVVELANFSCWVDENTLDEGTKEALRSAGLMGKLMFSFEISDHGVKIMNV